MNGRLYDPILGRMLSPDNYVQMPDYSQNFNRYSYVLNNPLKFTDPSGEKWWHWMIADIFTGGAISSFATNTVVLFSPFITEQGYEVQKYLSPVAIKLGIGVGSDHSGIGFDVSVGMNKGGTGYRYHFGATYYSNNYGTMSGWETRTGGELEVLPFISYSGTKFTGDEPQVLNKITIGDPFTYNSYENDTEMLPYKLPGVPKYDGGDRWRTASVKIGGGGIDIGLNLHTGMAGRGGYYTEGYRIKGDSWVFADDGADGNIDAQNQRAGVLYLGIGPMRIGANSEGIRHIFQNRLAHDHFWTHNYGEVYPWVRKLEIDPKFYWFFGSGSGNTNW